MLSRLSSSYVLLVHLDNCDRAAVMLIHFQVFINKRIFSDPNFAHAQVTFASYHFFITHITLHIMSTPSFSIFERRQLGILDLFPLASSMCLSVVLQNTSLQHCSVPFYQTVRVLLTPITAALNFFLYRQGIPWQAAVMLIPTCAGVGLMAYYDTKKAGSGQSQTTTVGATFALAGVVASAIYTVWVGRYQKKLDTSSIQLLHQQSLFGAVLLLFCIPFIDKLPHYSDVPLDRWIAILLSGTCAVIINVSSFSIIGNAGAVSATVVGHGKTVCIVVLGWFIGGKAVNHGSIAGIAVAIAGILA